MDRDEFFDRDDEDLADAMRVDELKQSIKKLKGINTTDLKFNLSNNGTKILEQMVKDEFRQCTRLVDNLIKDATEEGKEFK